MKTSTGNNRIRIGITGQAGFIGTHLYNYLGLQENVERIPFRDEFFAEEALLCEFVKQCDAIVHLAAVNRHHDSQTLHDTNIELVRQLIAALEKTERHPQLLFSSSIQERRDNIYGRSKRAGRELLADWAKGCGAPFTGLVIPNVFGPFGAPFYNSFIATFSHQLMNGLEPGIDIDAEVPLIYVNDLAEKIWQVIMQRHTAEELDIQETATIRVSDVLAKLQNFYDSYVKGWIIPDLSTYFDISLFNTFRSYLPENYFPRTFTAHTDDRGRFVELVKTGNGGQNSCSTTKPGITRGNHFHTRKVERFAVIRGEALIQLRRIGTDRIIEYRLSGDEPAYVDMPVWYTHNITNAGRNDLYTVFWINELYNPADPDTFFENVTP